MTGEGIEVMRVREIADRNLDVVSYQDHQKIVSQFGRERERDRRLIAIGEDNIKRLRILNRDARQVSAWQRDEKVFKIESFARGVTPDEFTPVAWFRKLRSAMDPELSARRPPGEDESWIPLFSRPQYSVTPVAFIDSRGNFNLCAREYKVQHGDVLLFESPPGLQLELQFALDEVVQLRIRIAELTEGGQS